MKQSAAASGQSKERTKSRNSLRHNTRYLTVTAMLSAVAYVLMFLEFSVPIVPSFLKLDLSDLPELLGAYALGPVCGILVCLIKNLLHLLTGLSSTGGVGELSNFLLGAVFVLPAGLLYRYKKTKRTALLGGTLGAVCMGLFSIVSNYFLVYPFYYKIGMTEEVVLSLYQAIIPGMKSILQSLICFNLPFTIAKGLISVAVAMLIYKPLSPILHGRE